jgi:lysyl-tRNA synthetase, class II
MAENEEIVLRKQKVADLNNLGINVYPHKYDYTHTAIQILEEFTDLKEGNESTGEVRVAGRIMTTRDMGKASFSHLKTDSNVRSAKPGEEAKVADQVQIYVRKDILGDHKYEVYKKLDIGDFIGVEGSVFRTRTGELTIKVKNMHLLSKALRPLPEKWHGLKDVETRYRQRYVDLVVNQPVKDVFITRSRIINALRNFLDKDGFLEVETPMMQSIAGGAAAKPFITHHHALDMDLYLRIAPELYLKRLIIGGLGRVYEINRNFRNEGISTRHNPEFTMMELYEAYSDYNDMMDLCEELLCYAAEQVLGTLKFKYQGKDMDFTRPWKRMTLTEAIKQATEVDFDTITTVEEAKKVAESLNVKVEKNYKRGKIITSVFEELVEANLPSPVFIIDYPKDVTPLAKSKEGSPDIVERFELYIGGQELANAYSELNDPQEQKQRLMDQMKEKNAGDEEAQMMDDDYVRAMEYGMPPCGGLGIGIDRLVMVLTDSASIRDVILFPQLKKEANQ